MVKVFVESSVSEEAQVDYTHAEELFNGAIACIQAYAVETGLTGKEVMNKLEEEFDVNTITLVSKEELV